MIDVLIVRPGDQGTTEFRTLDGDLLPQLQQLVGGYIEIVSFGPAGQLVCNEEGKLRGLPVNITANSIARYALSQPALRAGDTLVGTVVIVGPTDGNGELTSVRGAYRARIEGLGIPETRA